MCHYSKCDLIELALITKSIQTHLDHSAYLLSDQLYAQAKSNLGGVWSCVCEPIKDPFIYIADISK